MNKLPIAVAVCLQLFINVLSLAQSKTIKDIEGTSYPTIMIGKQEWMASNLNVSKFKNGDPIMEVKSSEEWKNALMEWKPAWCYYGYDAENGKKYGTIYNYFAVMDPRGLAPDGWHIPNEEEWKAMISELGDPKTVAAKLKSKTGWDDNKNGTNETGFNALPGGEKDEPNGETDHFGIGFRLNLWSSSIPEIYVDRSLAWRPKADIKTTGIKIENISDDVRPAYNKGLVGAYVRCVKGNVVSKNDNKVSFVKCVTTLTENKTKEDQIIRGLNKNIVLSKDNKTGIQMNFLQYDFSKVPVLEIQAAAVGASNCINEGNKITFLFSDGSKLEKENAGSNCDSRFTCYLSDRTDWNALATKNLISVSVETNNGLVEEKTNPQNTDLIKTSMQCLLSTRGIEPGEPYTFNCKNDIVGLSLNTPVLLLSRSSKGILITEIYSSSWDKLELTIYYMGMDKCIDTSSRLMLTFRDGKQIALTNLPENCNGEIKVKITATDDLKSLKTVELKSISVITRNGQVEELLTSEKSQRVMSAINCQLTR